MSDFTERKITYFHATGSGNTKDIARIVAERAADGDIEAVIVASSTGNTALEVARAVSRATKVFAVNFQPAYWDRHTRPDPETKKKAEALGAVFMPDSPTAKYLKDIPGHSADSLRLLGQGMKVAVEVIMQAVEIGHLSKGAMVIGTGGSSRGADVAIVARAAGPDDLSRFWISEILAKPR